MRGKSFFVMVFLLTTSCSAKEKTASQAKVATSLDEQKTLSALQKLRQNYPPYLNLTAQFVLKGKVDKKEILYDGILTVKKDFFSVVLKDPIFRSPFFLLKIEQDIVIQSDLLRNKTEKIPLADYHWVELFGRFFPFRFFYPMLQGYPPQEMFTSEVRYETLEDKERFYFETDYFDAIVQVEGGLMRNLYYRGKLHQEIVVLSFMGEANLPKTKDKSRYFPAQIYITRPRSDDYVRLEFTKVQIEMP